jgi:hypothetical protein
MVVKLATHKTIFLFIKIIGFGFEHIGIVTIGLIIIIIIIIIIIPFYVNSFLLSLLW